jgi:hypothetical protein
MQAFESFRTFNLNFFVLPRDTNLKSQLDHSSSNSTSLQSGSAMNLLSTISHTSVHCNAATLAHQRTITACVTLSHLRRAIPTHRLRCSMPPRRLWHLRPRAFGAYSPTSLASEFVVSRCLLTPIVWRYFTDDKTYICLVIELVWADCSNIYAPPTSRVREAYLTMLYSRFDCLLNEWFRFPSASKATTLDRGCRSQHQMKTASELS